VSCYQGFRYCDVCVFSWEHINLDKKCAEIIQEKTDVPLFVTLHPITYKILRDRYDRLKPEQRTGRVFNLPSLRACTYALEVWCRNAGVNSHITWHCARLSFSVLLQDNQVEAATVALLMGLTTVKYVLANYRRTRPKNALESLNRLPMPTNFLRRGEEES
jgi:integrase